MCPHKPNPMARSQPLQIDFVSPTSDCPPIGMSQSQKMQIREREREREQIWEADVRERESRSRQIEFADWLGFRG